MGEYLKCDIAACGHVEAVETITDQHIGKPCPACGANLLTQEDYDAWLPYQALMKLLPKANGPVSGQANGVAINVGLHGGKTTIEIDRGT